MWFPSGVLRNTRMLWSHPGRTAPVDGVDIGVADGKSSANASPRTVNQINIVRSRLIVGRLTMPFPRGKLLKGCTSRIVPNDSAFGKRNRFEASNVRGR